MKYLSILAAFILLGAGGRIKVAESTSQEWMGGLQQSGYGTYYKAVIMVKAGSDKLRIDELWVDNLKLPARAVTDLKNAGSKTFKRGDKVFVTAGITWKPEPNGGMVRTTGIQMDKPYNYKGQGLIGYTFKGKRAYAEIQSFKKLETIIYP
jgi:hypothetical protein